MPFVSCLFSSLLSHCGGGHLFFDKQLIFLASFDFGDFCKKCVFFASKVFWGALKVGGGVLLFGGRMIISKISMVHNWAQKYFWRPVGVPILAFYFAFLLHNECSFLICLVIQSVVIRGRVKSILQSVAPYYPCEDFASAMGLVTDYYYYGTSKGKVKRCIAFGIRSLAGSPWRETLKVHTPKRTIEAFLDFPAHICVMFPHFVSCSRTYFTSNYWVILNFF